MSLWARPRKKNKEIDLVLSSSGTRAACFIGALTAILEKGYSVKRIAGFSGGAIVAAGYALGMDVEELKTVAAKVPYSSFRDFKIRNLLSLSNPSVYTGEPLDNFYKQLFGDAKLKDFKIDCRIAVVTIIGRQRILLTKDTHPELLVWKAVRMSSTIPFIFPYMEIDGVAVTDGALVTNMFDIFPENERKLITLAPRADRSIKRVVQVVNSNRLFIWSYLRIIAEYFMDAVDGRHIPQEEWGKTVLIPTFEISGFNFEIDSTDVERLLQFGYSAVMVSDVLPSEK